MEKKLKFTQPVITRIKLDPEQAVLAVCMINGVYYGYSVGVVNAPCWGATTSKTYCPTPRRGDASSWGTFFANSSVGS